MMRYLGMLSLVTSTLWGGEPQVRAREAEALFQGGHLEKSAQLYRSLEEEALSVEQSAILRYNLATVYLDWGKWEEAEGLFSSLLEESQLSLALRHGATWNQALLHLRRMLALLEGEEESLLIYEKAEEEGIRAEALWEQAVNLEAELTFGEGELFSKGESPELQEVGQAIRQGLLFLRESRDRWRREEEDFTQKFQRFIHTLHFTHSSLDAVNRGQRSQGEPSFWEEQLGVYGQQHRNLLLEWEEVRKKLEKEGGEAAGVERLYPLFLEEGEKEHRIAWDWMAEGEGEPALAHLSFALIAAGLIEVSMKGEDPLRVALIGQKKAFQQERDQKRLQRWNQHAQAILSHQLRAFSSSETEEEPVARQVEQAFLEALQKEISAPPLSLEQVERVLALYEVAKRSLEELLLEGLARVQEGKAAQRGLYEAVKNKLVMWEQLAHEEEKKEAAREAHQELASALEGEKEWEQALKQALIAWAPWSLLRAQLKRYGNLWAKGKGAPFTPSLFGRLSEEGEEIGALLSSLEKRGDPSLFLPLKKPLKRAQGALLAAERRKVQGRERTARFLFADGEQEVKGAQFWVVQQLSPRLVTLLERGVEAMSFLVHSTDQAPEVAAQESTFSFLTQTLKEAVGRTLEEVAAFPILFEEEEDLPHRLQELFQRGKEEAERALLELGPSEGEMEKALVHERAALELWSEALKLLQEEAEDPSSSPEGEEEEESGESNPSHEESGEGEEAMEAEQQAEKAKVEQLLRQLQEMEREDAPASPAKRSVKKGLRPW